jgi:hypothetical protein
MCPSKRHDRVARLLQTLAKQGRVDFQRFGRLRAWQLENLPKDLRQPMRPIQALQHGQRTSDLDFFNEHGVFGISRAFTRRSFSHILGKGVEAQSHALDGALLHVENVAHTRRLAVA